MTDIQTVIKEKRGWFIALGIAMIILGLVAIAFPVMMTITAKIFLGWMFLIGGVVVIFHAFQTRDWKGFLWNLLIGVLYIIVGGWLAFFPLTGIFGLTILIAILFVVEGVMKTMMGFGLGPDEGRVWVIVSGIAAIVLGILLFADLPGSALWAIGLLVGINFLFSGFGFLTVAMAARDEPGGTASEHG